MLAAAGVSPDSAYPPDGMDLNSVLTGRRAAFNRTLYWKQPALRFNGAPPQAAVRRGNWKLLEVAERKYLFNLGNDPGERMDRSGAEPRIRAELERLLAEWTRTL